MFNGLLVQTQASCCCQHHSLCHSFYTPCDIVAHDTQLSAVSPYGEPAKLYSQPLMENLLCFTMLVDLPDKQLCTLPDGLICLLPKLFQAAKHTKGRLPARRYNNLMLR